MAEEALAHRAPSPAATEAVGLAHELVRAYGEQVDFLRQHMRMTTEEALEWIGNPRDPDTQRERLMKAPPERVFWLELAQLLERDPEGAQAAWERLKAEARAELDGGHRAAKALEHNGRPWERARFLALRQSFRDEWQPRGGIEDALIDTLALAHSSCLFWLARLHVQSTMEATMDAAELRQTGHWRGPRVKDAEAIEQSAAMAERFNRLFVRTLRTLRDLRRYAPAIHIEHAGQVNLAQGPQVNVAQSDQPDPRADLADSLPEGALRLGLAGSVRDLEAGGSDEE